MSVRSLAKVAFRGMSIALLATSLHAPVFSMPATALFGDGSPSVTAYGGFFDQNVDAPGEDNSRMATYDDPRGEITFALSLKPRLSAVEASSDIVIFFDTSASQTGVYKRGSLEALENMLSGLSANDRVKLVAIDLDPVVLTPQFVRPDSNDVAVAIENLRRRDALGSTDMALMLSSTPAHFAGTADDRNKNVVYIGDGISRAAVMHQDRLAPAITNLADSKISFSSFAIGPERNIALLAALANNTGGNIFIDNGADSDTKTAANGLVNTVHGSVFWPTSVNLPEQFTEILPASIPPMRSDRDTIVVGTIAQRGQFELTVNGLTNGQPASMQWTASSEQSNLDFSFLPQLIADARKDSGISLPTIGSEGLREAARVASVSSMEYSDLGAKALVSGNATAASQLAEAALARDPSNTEASLLARAANYKIQEDDPFGDASPPAGGDPFGGAPAAPPAGADPFGGAATPPPVQNTAPPANADPFGGQAAPAAPQDIPSTDPFGTADPVPMDNPVEIQQAPVEVQPPIQPLDGGAVIQPPMDSPGVFVESTNDSLRMVSPQASGGDEIDRLIRDTRMQTQGFLGDAVNRGRVITAKTRAQVEVELGRAREELQYAPGEAINRLKSMVEVLDNTTEVDPNVMQDLRNRLVSALMSSRREKVAFDNRIMLRDQQRAATIEQLERLRRYENREERIAGLINRFDYLLEERNYDQAYQVALEVYQYAPKEPAAVLADESGRIARISELLEEQRRLRQLNFVEALYQTEQAAIPMPGEPPMIFPDPLEWADKVAKRIQYQDIRLAGNDTDEFILTQLDEVAEFNYVATPFSEVMRDLRETYKINVVLDPSAGEDGDLPEDEPIDFEVTGIRLKNALRLMLKKYDATFIVKDEVLKIISTDMANDPENFVTNVYNVGDLVAPRQFRGGGGGQFGGGGGGQQQGGGGFGGGGQQGGGGGGGIFCIQDAPVGQAAQNQQPVSTPASPARVIEVNVTAGKTAAMAWSEYLAANEARPEDLRKTATTLMKNNDSKQVVDMIRAAMSNDQTQPWMIEALVIAMEVAEYPQSDIERALMSTLDFSDNVDDAMVAADYMVKNNMESRGIRLLQDISTISPVRPEPYVIGLNAAQRISDLEGIQWATLGILGQAWPEHREVVQRAIFAAEAVRDQLKTEGRNDELTAYNQQLDEALYRDCIIKVSWTGEADIDLLVEEPGGSLCTRQNPRTTAGGVMMGDQFTSEDQSGETAEYYVLPKGFSGDYKLYIRKVWGDVTADKVTVAIYHHFRSDKQASQQKQLEVDSNGSTLVNFTLQNGRRAESLDEHVLNSVADQQLLSTAAMNQMLDATRSSSAAGEYYSTGGSVAGGDQQQQGGGNQFGPQQSNLRRSTVGYRPEIQVIPEGAFMTATATTSDRLYVLVGAQPFFNLITRVDTFNILGGAGNAAGGGAGIGGGGGAGLGGGAGGGGLGGGGGGGGLF